MTGHWAGCPADRVNEWANRKFCAVCGVWLSPPTARVFARLGVQTAKAGCALATLPGPLDNRNPKEVPDVRD